MTNLYAVFNIPRRPWFERRAGLLVVLWCVLVWAVVFLAINDV